MEALDPIPNLYRSAAPNTRLRRGAVLIDNTQLRTGTRAAAAVAAYTYGLEFRVVIIIRNPKLRTGILHINLPGRVFD
jgi:hypothetical protein